jgi:hypothetical protein
LIEAKDEKRLMRYQKQMATYELLIVDELGFVPYPKPELSCCSKSSANAMNGLRPWSPAICLFRNGPKRSDPSA